MVLVAVGAANPRGVAPAPAPASLVCRPRQAAAAVPGSATLPARQRARTAALALQVPGFMFVAPVPVPSPAGVAGSPAPVVVGAFDEDSRVPSSSLVKLLLAVSLARPLLGCALGRRRAFGGKAGGRREKHVVVWCWLRQARGVQKAKEGSPSD